MTSDNINIYYFVLLAESTKLKSYGAKIVRKI